MYLTETLIELKAYVPFTYNSLKTKEIKESKEKIYAGIKM